MQKEKEEEKEKEEDEEEIAKNEIFEKLLKNS